MNTQQLTDIKSLANDDLAVETIIISNQQNDHKKCLIDVKKLAAERYGISKTGVYLIRPDQYVAARWMNFDKQKIRQAVQRSIAKL